MINYLNFKIAFLKKRCFWLASKMAKKSYFFITKGGELSVLKKIKNNILVNKYLNAPVKWFKNYKTDKHKKKYVNHDNKKLKVS